MTYQEMNRRLRAAIADEREAQAVGRMIIETAFGLSWADALCGGLKALSAADAERLETVVSRIEQGEPVQYAIGLAPFCGRLFEVTPAVLIPRPETEGLVAPLPSPLPSSILDIGTGSGCIAITLALMHPEAHVDAIDISEEALRVARRNAERLGANVNFWQMDILSEASLPFPQGGGGCNFALLLCLPYGSFPPWGGRERGFLPDSEQSALYRREGAVGYGGSRLGTRAPSGIVCSRQRPLALLPCHSREGAVVAEARRTAVV